MNARAAPRLPPEVGATARRVVLVIGADGAPVEALESLLHESPFGVLADPPHAPGGAATPANC